MKYISEELYEAYRLKLKTVKMDGVMSYISQIDCCGLN
jgi:hypothetical protein